MALQIIQRVEKSIVMAPRRRCHLKEDPTVEPLYDFQDLRSPSLTDQGIGNFTVQLWMWRLKPKPYFIGLIRLSETFCYPAKLSNKGLLFDRRAAMAFAPTSNRRR